MQFSQKKSMSNFRVGLTASVRTLWISSSRFVYLPWRFWWRVSLCGVRSSMVVFMWISSCRRAFFVSPLSIFCGGTDTAVVLRRYSLLVDSLSFPNILVLDLDNYELFTKRAVALLTQSLDTAANTKSRIRTSDSNQNSNKVTWMLIAFCKLHSDCL